MAAETSATPRPRRSDARLNRERILAAAADAISERGPGVSLMEIARRAGVGYATVHRNFTKDQLLQELFGEWFDKRRTVADRALRDPDPWQGLVTFLSDVLTDDGIRNRVMGALFVLHPAWRAQTRALTHALLQRAQAAGAARPDLTTTDVTLAVIGVARMMAVTGEGSHDQWRRHLTILLDGMRASHAAPLPGKPVSTRELEKRINAWSNEFLSSGGSAS